MPGTRHRWWALATLASGLALIVLDGTIVGVATPTIVDSLHLDLADAQWISSLYNVVFAALLLPLGRLGDVRGRRRLFGTGVVVFGLGSALASAAGSAGVLLLARAVQGIGGSMVLPSTLATVSATFRGRDRAVAFGVWGAVMSGAAAIGPLIGGWITSAASWRWVFLVNLPLCVLVLIGTLAFVPRTRGEPAGPGRADHLGVLLSAVGAGALVFGLIEGRSLGWWRPRQGVDLGGWHWPADAPFSPVTPALLLGAGALTAFVCLERRRHRAGRNVLLDLSLFGVPTFRWGNLTAATVTAGEFSLLFVLPLFLVNASGLDPMEAGLVLAAMALGAFVSGALARHLAARLGAAQVVVAGLVLELVGVLFTGLTTRSPLPVGALVVTLVVYGLGLGLASAQLTSTVLGDIPVQKSGSGSATQSTVRQLGSALGAALAGTLLGTRLAEILPGLLGALPGLPASSVRALVEGTTATAGGLVTELRGQGTTGSFGTQGPQIVDALSAGFARATRDSLWLTAGLLVLGLLGSLQVLRVARQSGSTAARSTGRAEQLPAPASLPEGSAQDVG